MFRVERALLDRERTGVEPGGLVEAALLVPQRGLVRENDPNLVVLRAQRGLEQGERSLEEGIRLVEATQSVHDRRQRADVGRDVGMLRSEDTLADLDRTARVRLGGGVVSASVRDPAKVVVERRRCELVRGGRRLDDRERPPVGTLALVEPTRVLTRDAVIVEESHQPGVRSAETPLGELQSPPLEAFRFAVASLRVTAPGERLQPARPPPS